ncbi:daunorubicin resistance protein DrrA family ABC transporter ATP-binding protein [Kineosporia sp. NBRC 101677]|uniref:ATP-binding cassette domain-containing protein n=1 Tax=Kineosporia sp. NBRC 101677 TaxID=3032197 RepID=UPI0024A03E24|nr:ATP-binding cassette domain-containing protein [Kineosporia sp. NBRC 101677]GLY15470.1 daunorubicin resistance protein DrrA family ABC transporter ATP-binding protein [Kineosporia sp. NBRC 101677]
MTNTAIEASGLRKAYKDKAVLEGIDFEVPAGSVFSLLGPNGAGKTTTVNVLTTLLRLDGGSARVAGFDVASEARRVRSAIGVTGQFASVDELLTGRENVQMMADLLGRRGSEPIGPLLQRFDLEEAADRRASTYSGGMRRKLDLAMTLVGRPQVLFLDEPTTGLDPRSRRMLWQIVRDLVNDGMTIFLTTQYLEEADRLADRIAVLDQGRLVAQGSPEELKRQIPGGHVELRLAEIAGLEAAARVLPEATPDPDNLILRVPSDGGVRSLRSLLDRLDEYAVPVEEFTVRLPDLDDVFLALTGQSTTATEETEAR